MEEDIKKLKDAVTILLGYEGDYANGVDLGVILDQFIEEHQKLIDNIKSREPICPICKGKMSPVNYKGYYDSFSFWECDCDHFLDGKLSLGQYA